MGFWRKFFESFFGGFKLWRKSKTHTSLMEALRTRLVFAGICCVFVYSCVSYRLADSMIISKFCRKCDLNSSCSEVVQKLDIVDRNGEILATSIPTASCFADPSVIIDIYETAKRMAKIACFPNVEKIKKRLSNKGKHFVWLARHISPKIKQEILDMGLPGIHFLKDYKRIYTHGNLFSHVIGCSDIDGNGVCGIEKKFSKWLTKKESSDKSLALSLDLKLQSIIHEELTDAINKFGALGGNAILMKTNGEILAMVSLPDFDPNNLKDTNSETMFNRCTLGVCEQGSVMKILNAAIALEEGTAKPGSIFNASEPIRLGRFVINDFRGKHRPLSLVETVVYSSNIASVKIAQTFGPAVQKKYMKRFGLLDKPPLEIQEVGAPLYHKHWTEATSMTVSYGYGLSVSSLQMLSAVTSIVAGGMKVPPTLLLNSNGSRENIRIVSAATSAVIRDLMRAVVLYGTGKKADIEGVSVFAKTGTAYKLKKSGYGNDGNRERLTTFIGGFPKDKPQFMLLISIDNPKASQETYGYATAGWNVVPTAKNILSRIVPLLIDCSEITESELKVAKYISGR
ncbi:peptidoglycan glycosyltransferase [Alphaproteobacteria bacterium]|nr:peptidoglycan glycosyltransferase [Alphaproteobacteria bacterium]